MKFKLFGDTDRTKELLLLLVIGGLFALSTALSNTFVNIYLWKQSGELRDIALYNLSIVCIQPVAFFIAGRLTKKIDRVIVLRIGVTILSLFYLFVLFLGEQASERLLLLGGLLGAGSGFYWLAFNVLTFEVTEPDTRDSFNGYLGVFNSLSGMVGPITSGFLISQLDKFTGYRIIFTVSLFLFFTAVVISFFLKRQKAEGKFHIWQILKSRAYNRNWARILYAHFFQGIREGTFIFLIVIWVYIISDSEFALGTFGLVQSAVSFIGYFVVSRYMNKERRKKSIFVGGLILFLSPFLFLMNVTFPLLMFYGVVISIAYPLLLVPYVSLTYDVIGRCDNAGPMRVEYIVVRELFLNAGRILSIVILLITIQFFNGDYSIPLLLPILGAGHFVIYFCVRSIRFSTLPKSDIVSNYSQNNTDREDGSRV
ncbi:MFS transporter [Fictibacillus sp. S7]|uniref:MFS transporter n=1 Tax=Fictibacillus sp. S7 TaxID=2212476 RepID=UPI0019D6FE53|nr:MFS transporter [Fictibacillus sp. S7]